MSQEAAVIETVAKFFFFASLDDQLSFSASLKVLSELKSRNRLDLEHRADWVETLHRWRPKFASLKPRTWADQPLQRGFQLPQEFDLGVWASFVSVADTSEVEAVLFSRILGFSDDEIAQGLGVSTGTVRYRVGRGLRHLGGFIES